jgi:hypothetical protein
MKQSLRKVEPTNPRQDTSFSLERCSASAEALSAASKRAGFKLGIDCAKLELAALGRTFSEGAQERWVLQRSALDSLRRPPGQNSDILSQLRSPTLPVLALVETGILSEAGLPSAERHSREEVTRRLCAAMVLARSMSRDSESAASTLCSPSAREWALADPLASLRDLELALLPKSKEGANSLTQAYWLPLGWRLENSASGPKTPAPEAPNEAVAGDLVVELDQISKVGDPPPAQ